SARPSSRTRTAPAPRLAPDAESNYRVRVGGSRAGPSQLAPLARIARDERLRLVLFVQAAATVLQVQGRHLRHVALTWRQHEVQRARLRFLPLHERSPVRPVVALHSGRRGVEQAERGALDGGQFTGGNGAHLESSWVGLAGHVSSLLAAGPGMGWSCGMGTSYPAGSPEQGAL